MTTNAPANTQNATPQADWLDEALDVQIDARGPDAAIVSGKSAAQAKAASPHCLDVDKWLARKGREVVELEPWQAARTGKDESGRRANGPPLLDPEQEAALAADCYAAAFEPRPTLLPEGSTAAPGEVRQYFDALLSGEEYAEVHASTQLDAEASELAALSFAQGAFATVAVLWKADGMSDAIKAGCCASGARKAARDAASAVAEFDTVRETFGDPGLGSAGGDSGARMSGEGVRQAFDRVRKHGNLRRIFEMAGRYRRLCSALQRQKANREPDEVMGVKLGGDVGSLVSGELAALGADGLLGLAAMRRLVESSAMQRDLAGHEKIGKGPIVVVLDESGSMAHRPAGAPCSRIEAAKGLALTIAWLARRQRRWCGLVGFSGGTDGNVLALPPGKWDQAALMAWLEHFYGNGTDMDVPLVELPFNYWPRFLAAGATKGKTDVLIVTDGVIDAKRKMIENYRTWAKVEKVRTIGLVLNSAVGDLEKIADEWHLVDRLGCDESGVEAALSI